MGRALKRLLILAGMLVAALAAGIFAMRSALVRAAEQSLVAALGAGMKTSVAVKDVDIAWGELIRLRPAVALSGVEIGNPEGFSRQPMITTGEIAAQVALVPLFSGRVEVMSLVLHQPVVRIEEDRRGRTNLEAWVAVLGSAREGREAPPGEGSKTALSIASLLLDGGQVRVARGGRDEILLDDIGLALSDFSVDRSCRLTLTARPSRQSRSLVSLESQAGPLSGSSVPLKGSLKAELGPGEIPKARRREIFGDFLGEPGDRGLVTLEASVEGDAATELRGRGKLKSSEIWIGRDASNRLMLEGETPFVFTARRLMSSPAFAVSVPKGSLRLGTGRWDGRVDVDVAGSRIRGSSAGAVKNIDIHELLRCFTPAAKSVFGRGEIPEYRVDFAGRGADELRNSLSGGGRVTLSEGRIGLFDIVATIRKHVARLLGGEEAAEGQTNFTTFATKFEIRSGRMSFADMHLANPSLELTGGGFVGFDETMRFDLISLVPSDILGVAAKAAPAAEKKGLRVPLRISGTLAKPKIRPELTGLVADRVKGLLEGLLAPKR
jgi:uncharacterized protein involved in outer membrane biogenesis